MVGTQHGKEYEDIFKTLKNAMAQIDERLKKPDCRWGDCNESFSTVDDLIQHVRYHHIRNDDGATQLRPAYTCKWNGCLHKAIHNKKLIEDHITEHTGKATDAVFSLLLADQARALSTPAHQMRWHPAVLRWCLQQHATSVSNYEKLRASGMLKLPSGRTLLRYQNFRRPQSGWNDGLLQTMREQYDEFIKQDCGRSDRSFFGGLYFDEVKVKEGLLWDQGTDTLVGFVDAPCMEGEHGNPEELLATHVLQFSLKSLFFKVHLSLLLFFHKTFEGLPAPRSYS